MTKEKYLKILVEDIHSSVMATIGSDGHPRTRVIDLMLWDAEGVYFLTAKGKEFYQQLMEQKYVALSATKEKISVSLHGKIRNIENKKLDEIFICRGFIRVIPERHWKYFRYMKRMENILTSVCQSILYGKALKSEMSQKKKAAIW